jgi:CheY-like chemotaxis protein
MSKAVLVVEDEVGVRRVLARLLGEKGFRTIEAGNGREAIERLAQETPAAIIIDLFMPIMSGIELLKALRRNAYYKKIPTIVMTGSGVAEVWGVPTVMKPNIEGIPDMVEAMILNAAAAGDAEAGVPRGAMVSEISSAIQ